MTPEQRNQRIYHHLYETCEGIAQQTERIVALEELVAWLYRYSFEDYYPHPGCPGWPCEEECAKTSRSRCSDTFKAWADARIKELEVPL